MKSVPDWELNILRRYALANMKERSDIKHQVQTPSGAGDYIRSYQVKPNGLQVPCRIQAIQFRSHQIEVYAGRETMSLVYKVFYPYDTDIGTNDRVTFAGNDYEVRILEEDMTDLITKIVHLSRVA